MIHLAQRTVVEVLRQGADRDPDRLAVRDAARSLTYEALWDRSLRMAAGFRRLGVEAAHPVVLLLDNSVDHALAWFGLSCMNAIEVPLNTATKGPQLAYVVNHCEARVMVVEAAYLHRIRDLADQLPALEVVVVRGEAPDAGALPWIVVPFDALLDEQPAAPAAVAPWDVLGIMYTSGTTGRSKGVLVSQAQTYGRMWPLQIGSPRVRDTTLVTLPIYHVIGQCRGLYNTLIAGGTTIIEPRFSASRFWDSCRTHGVTYVPLVGVVAGYLLQQPESGNDADNPVERMCLGTTIPQVERFARRFDVELFSSYGLTEAGGVLVGRAEPKGCGWVRDDFEARLVDERDQPVAAGEIGELVLRPTEPWTVMSGYHRDPAATLEKWRNLWLHTGDLMRQRDDGMHVFVDRRVEAIRRRGENIASAEVEEQILVHPDVRECAVLGVPVGEAEQEVLAIVAPEPGATIAPEVLLTFLVDRLPHYMVPRYIRSVDALPRTESTHRVTKVALGRDGAAGAWDREAAGLTVTRDGLKRTMPVQP